MKINNKIILLGVLLLTNLSFIVADDLSKNDNDLYLNINLFSMNFQSLSGEDTFKYSQIFGLSNEMKEHININENIHFELENAKSDLTKGNILYWSGLAGMIASPFIASNFISFDDENFMAAYLSSIGINTIIALIGAKYLYNASSHTNRAVSIYNIVN